MAPAVSFDGGMRQISGKSAIAWDFCEKSKIWEHRFIGSSRKQKIPRLRLE